MFFSSDAWYTSKGFLLSLRQVPCSEIVAGETAGRINDASVCDREFEAVNFDLRSELYPLNYPPSLNCRYVYIFLCIISQKMHVNYRINLQDFLKRFNKLRIITITSKMKAFDINQLHNPAIQSNIPGIYRHRVWIFIHNFIKIEDIVPIFPTETFCLLWNVMISQEVMYKIDYSIETSLSQTIHVSKYTFEYIRCHWIEQGSKFKYACHNLGVLHTLLPSLH